jgi:hypothetical protein
VRHLNHAAADVKRRTSEALNAEQFKTDARADNIYDRVNRADFVKVYALDWFVMNMRFGFGEPRKILKRDSLRRRLILNH